MQHFKFFDFLNVEVCAFKCTNEEDDSEAIRFIAVSDLGTIEMTPSFGDEATRDEAWDKSCEAIAKSLSIMIEDAFVEGSEDE